MSIYELHDHVMGIVKTTQFINSTDILVVKAQRKGGFSQEHLEKLLVLSQVGKNPFDNKETCVFRLIEWSGSKYLSHSTHTDALKKA
jgi:hypothetical protein